MGTPKRASKAIQLNYTLQSGILITIAHITKGKPLVRIFITDLQNTARATLDMESKRVIYCNASVEFTQQDVDVLVAAIKTATEPKTVEKT